MIAHTPPMESAAARRLITNVSWQAGSKALNLLMSVIAGGLVARHLAQELSQYRVAQFYVGLAAPLTLVISNSVVARRLVAGEDESAVLGSASRLIAVLGGAWFCAFSIGAWLFSSTAVGCLTLIAAASSLLVYWPIPCGHALEAHLHGRESALANTLGSFALRTWEIGCALFGAGVAWLAASNTVALIITMLLLARFYRQHRSTSAWTWRSDVAKSLLKESLPLILGGLASTALFRLNLVLLERWSGPAEASYYSAALELPMSAQLVAGVLLTVSFPGLSKLLGSDPQRANQYLEQFTRLCAALGLLAALGLWAGSRLWTQWIYGLEFTASAPVLAITAWLLPTLFLAQGRGAWLLHHQRTKIEFYFILAGVALDVVIARWLVPSHGAVGAAWALVSAYAFTWVLSSLLHRETRPLGWMQLRSLAWPVPSLAMLRATR